LPVSEIRSNFRWSISSILGIVTIFFSAISFCLVLYYFFLITISLPRVARDVFSPLLYNPTCRGSPLLKVNRSQFLTLHRRRVCSPSARFGTPWTRNFFKFTLLDSSCSFNQQDHLLQDVILHNAPTVLSTEATYTHHTCEGLWHMPFPLHGPLLLLLLSLYLTSVANSLLRHNLCNFCRHL
jgi:hypothetical protein